MSRISRWETLDPHLPEEMRMENIRKLPDAPKKGTGRPPGPIYLDAIRRRKKALAALPEALTAGFQEYPTGGRPRTRYTRKEVEEDAMRRMLPRALEVLEEQLEHSDAKVRQAAAVKVVEYVKGKPTQTNVVDMQSVSKVVYESAAWRPVKEIVPGQILEIEAGDDDDPIDDVA